jgi:hypothetical protein
MAKEEQEQDLSAEAVPPAYAAMALGLTACDWSQLGVDEDEDEEEEEDVNLENQALHETIKKRMTSILLVRLVALLAKNRAAFPDLSSSTICRTVLVQDHNWAAYAPAITEEFLAQLKQFVSLILDGYVRPSPMSRYAVIMAHLLSPTRNVAAPYALPLQ